MGRWVNAGHGSLFKCVRWVMRDKPGFDPLCKIWHVFALVKLLVTLHKIYNMAPLFTRNFVFWFPWRIKSEVPLFGAAPVSDLRNFNRLIHRVQTIGSFGHWWSYGSIGQDQVAVSNIEHLHMRRYVCMMSGQWMCTELYISIVRMMYGTHYVDGMMLLHRKQPRWLAWYEPL